MPALEYAAPASSAGSGPRQRASLEMQLAQTIDDVANLAVRVVNLLQRILDALDSVFGQFDQHGGGVWLEQFCQ
ncbi:MAG: hypothetical protein Q8L93_02150 [Rhodocyclaceae bacterium]|nr:hypothetical protein [Rhodocyclaceae bacterium]